MRTDVWTANKIAREISPAELTHSGEFLAIPEDDGF